MNASKISILSKIAPVLGLLGSAAAAYLLEVNYDDYAIERSWPLTIVIFLGGLFCTIVLYAILDGIVMLLDNQETIIDKPNDSELNTRHAESGNRRRPRCGKLNDASVGACSCCTRKPS